MGRDAPGLGPRYEAPSRGVTRFMRSRECFVAKAALRALRRRPAAFWRPQESGVLQQPARALRRHAARRSRTRLPRAARRDPPGSRPRPRERRVLLVRTHGVVRAAERGLHDVGEGFRAQGSGCGTLSSAENATGRLESCAHGLSSSTSRGRCPGPHRRRCSRRSDRRRDSHSGTSRGRARDRRRQPCCRR